jgi:hypothetical protein
VCCADAPGDASSRKLGFEGTEPYVSEEDIAVRAKQYNKLSILHDPEDEGDMFLRNIVLSPD